QVFNNISKVIITCNKRLASYLSQEVEELGLKPTRVFSTGIELNASLNDCIKLNLNLHCASQILYSVKRFDAQNADDVYREVASIAWEDLIDFNGYVSIRSEEHTSELQSRE